MCRVHPTCRWILISEGEIGRAARVHDASAFAPPTPETVQALRDLHPDDATPLAEGDIQPPPDGVDAFRLSMLGFARTARRLPRFSAHGLDLSRFEHIRDLQRHDARGFACWSNHRCRTNAGCEQQQLCRHLRGWRGSYSDRDAW